MKVLILLSMLFVIPAWAEVSYCEPIKNVSAVYCQENTQIAAISEECVSNIYQLSQELGTKMKRASANAIAAATPENAQRKQFEVSSLEFKNSVSELDELLTQAKFAQARIDEYLMILQPPPEAYGFEISVESSHSYARSEPCFINALLEVEGHYDEVTKIINETLTAKNAAEALLASTLDSEKGLNFEGRLVRKPASKAVSNSGLELMKSNISATTRRD